MLLLESFSWRQLLLGNEQLPFLVEIAIRTVIMFVVILVALRLMGKRGVKQLSVFEMVVIISLGSAAGDPMFMKDVGLVNAVFVFMLIVLLYRATTALISRNRRLQKLVEGECTLLIRDGCFAIGEFKKEPLAQDEFFAELRQQSVYHLGQVEYAFIEVSGELSLFFYPDEEVKYGLPVLPDMIERASEHISRPGHYACTFCGNTRELKPAAEHRCGVCNRTRWARASNRKRIS